MINNWTYNGKVINSIDEMKPHIKGAKPWGFVYKLTLYDIKTGKLKFHYIGKKNLFSVRSKDATKKEMLELPKSAFRRKKVRGGTIKYYRTVIKESDWKTYISSNNFIRMNLKKFKIEREILMFCSDDSDLSYREAREIICQDALDDDIYLNDGVSLRRFGKKIIKG